jgi:hypothetical protein
MVAVVCSSISQRHAFAMTRPVTSAATKRSSPASRQGATAGRSHQRFRQAARCLYVTAWSRSTELEDRSTLSGIKATCRQSSGLRSGRFLAITRTGRRSDGRNADYPQRGASSGDRHRKAVWNENDFGSSPIVSPARSLRPLGTGSSRSSGSPRSRFIRAFLEPQEQAAAPGPRKAGARC